MTTLRSVKTVLLSFIWEYLQLTITTYQQLTLPWLFKLHIALFILVSISPLSELLIYMNVFWRQILIDMCVILIHWNNQNWNSAFKKKTSLTVVSSAASLPTCAWNRGRVQVCDETLRQQICTERTPGGRFELMTYDLGDSCVVSVIILTWMVKTEERLDCTNENSYACSGARDSNHHVWLS